ncbi:MAG: alpha/beta hydrolase [Candidatus Rokuibacteriota bacterium]|nr:MAG: alpha/beta hydrolase [Candidatus Rokubacteria bacterium]
MPADRTFQDQNVYANGLRLHYLTWGNDAAPPMLLLHGFSGHAHTWDLFARAMCDQFRVLALDQRGHGDSDWAKDGAYTVDDHAADISAFHDGLRLSPVVLIGLSMGGRNAIRYTAGHPGKVERLVIVDIGPDIAPQGAERVRRMAAEAPEEFASLEEAVAYLRKYATLTSPAAEAALRYRVEHGMKKLSNGRYAWKYDKFLRDQRRQGSPPQVDLWPVVPQIKVPTLVLRGSESDVFAPETAKRMHELIAGSRLVEIPGAGHSVPADAPDAFERAVRQFLGI